MSWNYGSERRDGGQILACFLEMNSWYGKVMVWLIRSVGLIYGRSLLAILE